MLTPENWACNGVWDVLSGLPAGEPIVQITATPTRLTREGFVIRFQCESGSWILNVQRGDGQLDMVARTPSAEHACVVAGGHGYWIPVANPTAFEVIPAYPVMGSLAIEPTPLLLLWDYVRVTAYDVDGLRWISRDVSWDGIEMVRMDGEVIVGMGWSAPEERDVEFAIDPVTGTVVRGPLKPPSTSTFHIL